MIELILFLSLETFNMHKKNGKRGRPKVRCSPRNGRLHDLLAPHVAPQQDAQGPVDTDLSAIRRAAANKRWEMTRARQVDFTVGTEFEIYDAEEDTSDDSTDTVESDVENEVDDTTSDGAGDTLTKTSAWRHWSDFQKCLPSNPEMQAALLKSIQK